MFILHPGQLTLAQLQQLYYQAQPIKLPQQAYQAVQRAHKSVQNVIKQQRTVYGINTGFGLLAKVKIAKEDICQLQYNLIVSHATGVGAPLADAVTRFIMLLKINALAQGYSGVSKRLLDTLVTLYNADILPVIPAQGSVGASGDLAPLAHMSLLLLGIGQARYQGKTISARRALRIAQLQPVQLAPKEGLALLNGTQVSTALALAGLWASENILNTAILAGSMSLDAAQGSVAPFHSQIHQLRGQAGQMRVAEAYRLLLADSQILAAHKECDRVQDPYSLRCQPQILGACLDQLNHAAGILSIEANAVTDNPLVVDNYQQLISGGNFHAEPVAFAADNLAIALAEITNLAERRIALLMDPHLSGLPAFLAQGSGLHSGLMNAHVTAAALASENKSLAHPASVDTIPTSANQEDHVSMATYAARRLSMMAENTAHVLAIELLAANRGIALHQPLKTATRLLPVLAWIQRHSQAKQTGDYYMAPDIVKIAQNIMQGQLNAFMPIKFI
ncbi:MAG: histidine ammonia-lyase [Gammaproteobacteria bacterium]